MGLVSGAVGYVLLWVVVPNRTRLFCVLVLRLQESGRRDTAMVSSARIFISHRCGNILPGDSRLPVQGCESPLLWSQSNLDSTGILVSGGLTIVGGCRETCSCPGPRAGRGLARLPGALRGRPDPFPDSVHSPTRA